MSDQIFAGIGNEVTVFAAVFIALLIPSVIYFWRNRSIRLQNMHTMMSAPDRGDNVDTPSVYNRDTCPICLGEHVLPLETNCGHLFCGTCLQQYYSVSNVSIVRCPLCRSDVNILFVCFTNTETENPALQDSRHSIYNFVDEYNQRCSLFRRSLAQVLLDWPTTMRHLWNELFSANGFMYGPRAPIGLCIIAAIVYIVSPLDIIPEGIFGLLGLLDDLFVILMIGLYMSIVYRRLVIMRGAASNDF